MKILHDVYPAVFRAVQLRPEGDPERLSDEVLASLDPYSRRLSHAQMVDRARIVVTQGTNLNRLIIAVDRPEGVRVILNEEYSRVFVHPVSPRLNPINVLLVSDRFVTLQRDTGCGCGSRLRGWNPYSSGVVYSDMDPGE